MTSPNFYSASNGTAGKNGPAYLGAGGDGGNNHCVWYALCQILYVSEISLS